MARLRGARQVSGSSRQGDGKRQEAGVRGAGRGTVGIKGGQVLVLKSAVQSQNHAKSGGDRLCHFQFGGGVLA